MLFNSVEFALFLPVVFALYWFAVNNSLKAQNMLLLLASYYFYSCWDWRFLFLLVFSTGLDYVTALKITASGNAVTRKTWFWLSIIINAGFLGVFKYYNFFSTSFAEAIAQFGYKIDPWTLQVILPVGISFYTFHGLSYVIDVYKNRIPAEKSYVDYALFVSFFPLLVAGPIERATHLLPQIKRQRTLDYNRAVDGLRQMLWGLFKKVVIADQAARYVNLVFNATPDQHFSGVDHALAAFLFAIQIYCDFSGYSDIALGTARLFGIELLRNFAYPYFSRDIAEFWRRWHISLSSWFRDYLYIPLGGSRAGTFMKVRNVFIIFLVSGFWHGANWTFIIWGAINALLILPSVFLNTNRRYLEIVAQGRVLPTFKEAGSIALTFTLTVFAWIFFRAESAGAAIRFIGEIFSPTVFQLPSLKVGVLLILIILFMACEWLGREENYAIAKLGLTWPRYARWAGYYAIIMAIAWFAVAEQQFIYFQF